MSKVCRKCYFETSDDTVFCPACGSVLDDTADPRPEPAGGNNTAGQPDRRYAQPINAGVGRRYAQPLQAQAQSQPAGSIPKPVQESRPAKTSVAKKRLPYILIGFFAAAAIFAVALIFILGGGEKLVGNYDWTNGENGATGTLTISEHNGSVRGLFVYNGEGTVTVSFSTKEKTASYFGSDGNLKTGTYDLNGDDLSITVDGYTDTFRRQ